MREFIKEKKYIIIFVTCVILAIAIGGPILLSSREPNDESGAEMQEEPEEKQETAREAQEEKTEPEVPQQENQQTERDQGHTLAVLPSGIPYISWAITVANDDAHGYSKSARNGAPDFDAITFIWYALTQDGFSLGDYPPPNTTALRDALLKAGFEYCPVSSTDDVMEGDIIFNSIHAEIYIGDGQMAGARHGESYKDEAGNVKYRETNCEPGDQAGDEISIEPYTYTWWINQSNGEHYAMRLSQPSESVDTTDQLEAGAVEEEEYDIRMPLDLMPFKIFINDEDLVEHVYPGYIDNLIDAIKNGELTIPDNAVFIGFNKETNNITYESGGETYVLLWENKYANTNTP